MLKPLVKESIISEISSSINNTNDINLTNPKKISSLKIETLSMYTTVDNEMKKLSLFNQSVSNNDNDDLKNFSLKGKLFELCSANTYKKIDNHKSKIEKLIEVSQENLNSLNINVFNEILENIVKFINKFYFKIFLVNSEFKNIIDYILIALSKDFNPDDIVDIVEDSVKKIYSYDNNYSILKTPSKANSSLLSNKTLTRSTKNGK